MRDLQMASFLACSWFWCIGGFFPVLLHQDFGDISFPAFLIFNCMGAALFGFVWKNTARLRFLDRFGRAATGFSGLVAGYHVVFITWISLLLQSALPLIGFATVTFVFFILRTRLITLSLGMLALTIGLFALIASSPILPFEAPPPNSFLHQILPLAFGFLLAPYFDLTFHRAFSQSKSPRLVFLIGFGAIFPVLLCGMYYALPAFAGVTTAGGLTHPAITAVVMLLVLQTSFTTAAHLREIEAIDWLNRFRSDMAILAVVSLCLVHVLAAFVLTDWMPLVGELIYRNFVFVIGAIFPVILLFGGLNASSAKAIAFVTPCYALGFLIGGAFAPFLSIAMAGLALIYWRHRFVQTGRLSTAPFAGDKA